MTLLKNYIVVELRNGDKAIAKRSAFAECNFCECFDDYGNKIGCNVAGCWTEETARDLGEEWDGQEEHTKVLANTYWDGSNWRSDVLEDDYHPTGIVELPEEEQLEILQDWQKATDCANSVWIEKGGVKTIKGEKYSYTYSLYSRDAGYICYLEAELN